MIFILLWTVVISSRQHLLSVCPKQLRNNLGRKRDIFIFMRRKDEDGDGAECQWFVLSVTVVLRGTGTSWGSRQ
jgi:hypothetical protein